jgi:pentatricopeptide repeat protein
MTPIHLRAETYGYVKPSLVTFNTLISACGKAGKYSEALDLYERMQQSGLDPDSFTICSLITAAGKVGRWRAALELFQEFCRSRGRPNVAVYNALVRPGRLPSPSCSCISCYRAHSVVRLLPGTEADNGLVIRFRSCSVEVLQVLLAGMVEE